MKSSFEFLTPSQFRVIDLIAQGLTNKEVGKRLYIAPSTVQAAVRDVKQTLGLSGNEGQNSRVALVIQYLTWKAVNP